jgi:hypothetical protein
LGGMSSLGTVQRCQNPVVLPSLHGGLPPAIMHIPNFP